MFQICLAEDDFPFAMIAILENERWIWDHRQPAVDLWYLAEAPAAAVAARGAPKLLGAAALDVAVTASLNGAANGHLWLHAAPEGGGRLLDWYARRRLERVPLGTRLPGPRILGRVNDGRYFYVDPGNVKLVSGSMEEYRS